MLKKQLGPVSVFSIAAGAMISSGLFILPGLAFAKAGPSIIISYFLAGLLMIPSMLSSAELATAMPKAGGSYFFIERSLGPLMRFKEFMSKKNCGIERLACVAKRLIWEMSVK